jgi:hypothetical protein
MWFVGEYEYREQEAALSLAGMDRRYGKIACFPGYFAG